MRWLPPINDIQQLLVLSDQIEAGEIWAIDRALGLRQAALSCYNARSFLLKLFKGAMCRKPHGAFGMPAEKRLGQGIGFSIPFFTACSAAFPKGRGEKTALSSRKAGGGRLKKEACPQNKFKGLEKSPPLPLPVASRRGKGG